MKNRIFTDPAEAEAYAAKVEANGQGAYVLYLGRITEVQVYADPADVPAFN